MTRADRKNAVLRKTRLNRGVRPLAAASRLLARNYEALSKTRYSSVRISNFGLKFSQYILNILYFRIQQKKIDFFNPSYQTTTINGRKQIIFTAFWSKVLNFLYNWYIDSVCEDKALHQV